MESATWRQNVSDFNATYNSNLALLRNDCSHYAAELVKQMTGQDLGPLNSLELEVGTSLDFATPSENMDAGSW